MFTITDYYNLLDFKGNIFDAIHDYGLTFSETITGLYNNFIEHTSESDQQAAHDIVKNMYNASNSIKKYIMDLINIWAYDSISHGI